MLLISISTECFYAFSSVFIYFSLQCPIFLSQVAFIIKAFHETRRRNKIKITPYDSQILKQE